MQKCENKAVCVKPGLGVTPVPEQVGVSVAPPAAHPSQLSAAQAGSSLGTATAALGGTLGGISPLEEMGIPVGNAKPDFVLLKV